MLAMFQFLNISNNPETLGSRYSGRKCRQQRIIMAKLVTSRLRGCAARSVVVFLYLDFRKRSTSLIMMKVLPPGSSGKK